MLRILLLGNLLSLAWSSQAVEPIPKGYHTDRCGNLHCFHTEVGNCPPRNTCRCVHISPNCSKAALCCNIENEDALKQSLDCAKVDVSKLEALHIRNATFTTLNVAERRWRRLKSMAITDGKINSLIGEFAKHTTISCLNLSSNGISEFENRSLVNLYNLSVLDLSNNNLPFVPHFKKGPILLDISHNKMMQCSSITDALQNKDLNFKNENETLCLSSSSFHWFNATDQMSFAEVKRLYEYQDCIENCQCEPHRLDLLPGKLPTIAMRVNCAGKHLTALPPKLPPNTISLNISNNNISSLQPITDDISYAGLRELFADNNEITSILPLEGSKFIDNFLAIHLRNNKIDDLPTYFLSNMIDRNYNPKQLKFGKNYLKCDCNKAKALKVWLLTKQKHIPDFDEIYCEDTSRVVDLDLSKLCQSEKHWTDYIYYIITAEVLLLVFLIAKVSYDYWVFKTAGYLPWPASKMPKLPCDWLCE